MKRENIIERIYMSADYTVHVQLIPDFGNDFTVSAIQYSYDRGRKFGGDLYAESLDFEIATFINKAAAKDSMLYQLRHDWSNKASDEFEYKLNCYANFHGMQLTNKQDEIESSNLYVKLND